MPIRNLATHPAQFVTIAELAEYWAVSRQQIHKRIESGSLSAIRFSERLYRVRTQEALEFERRASVRGVASREAGGQVAAELDRNDETADMLPKKIGLRRVRRESPLG